METSNPVGVEFVESSIPAKLDTEYPVVIVKHKRRSGILCMDCRSFSFRCTCVKNALKDTVKPLKASKRRTLGFGALTSLRSDLGGSAKLNSLNSTPTPILEVDKKVEGEEKEDKRFGVTKEENALRRLLCAQSARPLPLEPTDAIPGSAEKMKIMEERERNGFHIHHPQDKRGY